MKTTTYKCDRCGAELGECGAAVERAKFVTQEIVLYRMRFFKNWKDDICQAVDYELCESCRESLERWLSDENAG